MRAVPSPLTRLTWLCAQPLLLVLSVHASASACPPALCMLCPSTAALCWASCPAGPPCPGPPPGGGGGRVRPVVPDVADMSWGQFHLSNRLLYIPITFAFSARPARHARRGGEGAAGMCRRALVLLFWRSAALLAQCCLLAQQKVDRREAAAATGHLQGQQNRSLQSCLRTAAATCAQRTASNVAAQAEPRRAGGAGEAFGKVATCGTSPGPLNLPGQSQAALRRPKDAAAALQRTGRPTFRRVRRCYCAGRMQRACFARLTSLRCPTSLPHSPTAQDDPVRHQQGPSAAPG